ncbi:MAG: hypothetical protein HDT13_08115 [Butyrivibrio sp.]|nr:hypothetical protein [Butyrivibrio sp.]
MNDVKPSLVSAIVSGAVTLIINLISFIIKERSNNKKAKKTERKENFINRPEIDIVDFKNYISRTRYGIKQKCDIELFVAHIENVLVEDKYKNSPVYAYYNTKEFSDISNWCCCIYTFENKGKTDISTLYIVCNAKKNTCIFPSDESIEFMENNFLNYSYCYDRKIRVGEKITVKLCYYKKQICSGIFSAIMSIDMEDDNGCYWTQPWFAPNDKVYDSRRITYKDFREEIRKDSAEECFRNPFLW